MTTAHDLERDIDMDLGGLFAAMWRKRAMLLGLSLLAAIVAFGITQVISPKYKSETSIKIERRSSNIGGNTRGDLDGQRTILDQEGIGSQVQIITSRDVARAVITNLGLAKLPEFDAAQTVSLFDRVLLLLGVISNPVDTDTVERAMKAYFKNLKVTQIARTRVIKIEFSSTDAKRAQTITKAIAEEYLRIQTNAKTSLNEQEASVLEPQIRELVANVEKAEAAVAEYRETSDLPLGRNNASLATQELGDMSSELSRVRSERASAEAKVASVRQALNSGASIDSVPDVLSAPLIQRLQERQVTLRAQIAELSTTLLSGHPRIQSLNSQLNNLGQQIRKEAQKILRSFQSDATIARSRETALKASVQALKAESGRVGAAQVKLRALQREAVAQSDLLKAYQRRYSEAKSKQQKDFLAADAWIFSYASLPVEPYFPKTLPFVAAAFFGTLLLGSMVVLAGTLARARPADMTIPNNVTSVAYSDQRFQPTPYADELLKNSDSHEEMENSLVDPTGRQIAKEGAAIAAMSIGLLGRARIALLSPEGEVGSEGSVLLARYLASSGSSVIVVDMTGAGASSLAMIGPHVVPGIKDLLAGDVSFADVIHNDRASRAHIIPTGEASSEVAAAAGDQLFVVFDALEDTYDYVVIDCGAADVAGLSKITNPNTINVINAIDKHDPSVRLAADMLVHAGFSNPMIIHPSIQERQLMGTVAA